MAQLTQIEVNGVTYDIADLISGFVTTSVNNLANYYLKSETYTRAEVQQLIAAIQGVSFVSVATLPTASADTMGGKIYLVPSSNPKTQNVKDEYITIEANGSYSWEKIGSTEMSLDGYVTDAELNAALSDYTNTADLTALLSGKVDKETGKGLSENDYTDEDKALVGTIAGKQDTIQDLDEIRSGAALGATAYQKPVTGIPATDLAGAVQTSLGKADTALQQSDLEPIKEVIPDAATAQNKLADKAFVNSSIATATATFRGAYNLVTDLSLTAAATRAQIATALAGAVSTADNNDYAFVQVPTSDVTPTEIARVDRYKFDGTAWAYEWSLNNSSFTASQWAALNSGITSGLVGKLSALPTNSELTTLLAGKQDTISDLSTIRAGAGLGATAVQPEAGKGLFSGSYNDLADKPTIPDVSGKEDTSNKVTSLSAQSTDTQYPSAKATYDAINPSVQSSQPVGGFEPNVVYDLGELTGSVTFALASPTDNAIPNPYHWTFDTGSTAPTVNWPNNIIWPDGVNPTIEADKHYEVLVRNGYGSILVFSIPVLP